MIHDIVSDTIDTYILNLFKMPRLLVLNVRSLPHVPRSFNKHKPSVSNLVRSISSQVFTPLSMEAYQLTISLVYSTHTYTTGHSCS